MEAKKIKKAESDATYLARALLRQVESRDAQCAFWVISAFDKLRRQKSITVTCIANILKQEMPKSYQDYVDYLKNT